MDKMSMSFFFVCILIIELSVKWRDEWRGENGQFQHIKGVRA
jgi:hypothetical protein